ASRLVLSPHIAFLLLSSFSFSFCVLSIPPPPRYTLFPYTTLFRSYQAVHPAAQWKGRALPENPGRGTALCPKFQQRGGPLVRDLCLEHPLQLPPPAQRRRGLATSISSPGGCH